jgi:hypothetical protein
MVIMVCLPKSENKRRPHQVYFSPSEKCVNSASTIVERMSALGQERTLRQPDLAAIQFKQGENEHGRLESHKVYLSERLLYLLYVLPYRIKVPL